jgi:magnesium-transporting ATPase (P-type)
MKKEKCFNGLKMFSAIMVIFGIILSFICFIGIFTSSNTKEIKIVKCYDSKNNEILGQKCEEIKDNQSMSYAYSFLGVLLGTFIFFISNLMFDNFYENTNFFGFGYKTECYL